MRKIMILFFTILSVVVLSSFVSAGFLDYLTGNLVKKSVDTSVEIKCVFDGATSSQTCWDGNSMANGFSCRSMRNDFESCVIKNVNLRQGAKLIWSSTCSVVRSDTTEMGKDNVANFVCKKQTAPKPAPAPKPTPTVEIKEDVTCKFTGAIVQQRCVSKKGSCESNATDFTSCIVKNIKGKKNEKIIWSSNCNDKKTTTVIGGTKRAEFDCRCIDSDGGVNPFEAGSTTAQDGSGDQDVCSDVVFPGRGLIERFCDQGTTKFETQICQTGCETTNKGGQCKAVSTRPELSGVAITNSAGSAVTNLEANINFEIRGSAKNNPFEHFVSVNIPQGCAFNDTEVSPGTDEYIDDNGGDGNITKTFPAGTLEHAFRFASFSCSLSGNKNFEVKFLDKLGRLLDTKVVIANITTVTKASWICNDNIQMTGKSQTHVSATLWLQYAAKSCEGHCDAENVCGVKANSFALG